MIDDVVKPDDNKAWVKEFTKCPACGGTERMFEQMWQEMIERGLAPPEMHFYYDMRKGPMADEKMMAKLPIGSEIPGFIVATDICLACGLIYAVKLEATRAAKRLAPVQILPNRAQRRAGMQGGQGFTLKAHPEGFILPS